MTPTHLLSPTAIRCNPTAISLQAGSELFLRFVTRTAAQTFEDEAFDACKAQLIQRGNLFAETSAQARQTIAALGAAFIRNGSTVLIHGSSRVVLTLLQHAATQVGHRTNRVRLGRRGWLALTNLALA